ALVAQRRSRRPVEPAGALAGRAQPEAPELDVDEHPPNGEPPVDEPVPRRENAVAPMAEVARRTLPRPRAARRGRGHTPTPARIRDVRRRLQEEPAACWLSHPGGGDPQPPGAIGGPGLTCDPSRHDDVAVPRAAMPRARGVNPWHPCCGHIQPQGLVKPSEVTSRCPPLRPDLESGCPPELTAYSSAQGDCGPTRCPCTVDARSPPHPLG